MNFIECIVYNISLETQGFTYVIGCSDFGFEFYLFIGFMKICFKYVYIHGAWSNNGQEYYSLSCEYCSPTLDMWVALVGAQSEWSAFSKIILHVL